MKEKESQDLVAQTRTLEYDISKQLARIDDLNKLIDTKTFHLKNKDAIFNNNKFTKIFEVVLHF